MQLLEHMIKWDLILGKLKKNSTYGLGRRIPECTPVLSSTYSPPRSPNLLCPCPPSSAQAWSCANAETCWSGWGQIAKFESHKGTASSPTAWSRGLRSRRSHRTPARAPPRCSDRKTCKHHRVYNRRDQSWSRARSSVARRACLLLLRRKSKKEGAAMTIMGLKALDHRAEGQCYGQKWNAPNF